MNIMSFLKKYKFASMIVFALAVVTTIGIILIIHNNSLTNITTSKLEMISPLAENDEASATKLVEKNIVKIINKLDNGQIIGTGFFDQTGYLVTNSHVVDRKGTVTVIYNNGEEEPATILSNDITSDVAILYVKNPKVKALYLGSTMNLQVTNTVLGIGYAFNLVGDATVTKGSVSARRSMIGIEYIQTDAAINSGCSGGPLINPKGEVVGINSLANNNATIGMAISSESLRIILDKLINNRKVEYVTGERPKNVLSTILQEVGYSTSDLYNEGDFIKDDKEDKNNESNNEDDKKDKNDEGNNEDDKKDNSNVSSDTEQKVVNTNIKSFSVNNQTITVDNSKGYPEFKGIGDYGQIVVREGTSEITLSVVAEDPNAKIEGTGQIQINKGTNTISFSVNGKAYSVNVVTSVETIEGMKYFEFDTVTIRRSDTLNTNCFGTAWYYLDSDEVHINPDGPEDVFSSITVDVYKIWIDAILDFGVAEQNLNQKIFTKTFYPSDKTVHNHIIDIVPVSTIRSLLTDADYGTNFANLTFVITVNTRHQGTFKTRRDGQIQRQ